MTFAQFLANPMAPVLVIFLVVMLGFAVALLLQDNEPTPEYTRLMAEHAQRQAEWEANAPARREAARQAYLERTAKIRAQVRASYGLKGE